MVSYYSSLRGGTCSCFLRSCTYARHGFVFPSRASFIDRNLIRVLPHLQYTNYPFHCSIYSVYQTSFILLVRFEWYLNWWRLKQCNSEYDCKAHQSVEQQLSTHHHHSQQLSTFLTPFEIVVKPINCTQTENSQRTAIIVDNSGDCRVQEVHKGSR